MNNSKDIINNSISTIYSTLKVLNGNVNDVLISSIDSNTGENNIEKLKQYNDDYVTVLNKIDEARKSINNLYKYLDKDFEVENVVEFNEENSIENQNEIVQDNEVNEITEEQPIIEEIQENSLEEVTNENVEETNQENVSEEVVNEEQVVIENNENVEETNQETVLEEVANEEQVVLENNENVEETNQETVSEEVVNEEQVVLENNENVEETNQETVSEEVVNEEQAVLENNENVEAALEDKSELTFVKSDSLDAKVITVNEFQLNNLYSSKDTKKVLLNTKNIIPEVRISNGNEEVSEPVDKEKMLENMLNEVRKLKDEGKMNEAEEMMKQIESIRFDMKNDENKIVEEIYEQPIDNENKSLAA